MVTALCTGSKGFVGSRLVEYLKSLDYDVLEYDLKLGLDILDKETLKLYIDEADEIYHLAGQVAVAPGEADPYLDLDINVKGMLNILDYIKGTDKKLIFTSSGSVYGFTDSFPHNEDALLRPNSNYGISKLCAELYLMKTVMMDNIDAKIVRFSSIYGPGRRRTGPINIFLEQAVNGEPITVYGDGLHTRDYVYVDDAVEGIYHVLHHGVSGEAYNIGTGKENSVKEIADIVSELTGAEVIYHKEKFSPYDVRRSCYDVTKINKIGWYAKTSLPVGIPQTYKWVKEFKMYEY